VQAETVPSLVREAVLSWARGRDYDTECLRFFDASEVFVIAAPAGCEPQGPPPDHFAITAFDRSGEKIGEPISDYWDSALVVKPQWRRKPSR
jgi:hypothetical protein